MSQDDEDNQVYLKKNFSYKPVYNQKVVSSLIYSALL